MELDDRSFDVALQSNKLILVDFYADWCKPCRDMSNVLQEIASENVKIYKVNVDKNYDLQMRYNIISLPTLKFMRNGIELMTLYGYTDKNTIMNYINQL